MLVEGFAVVGADININTDNFARGLPRIQAFHHVQLPKSQHKAAFEAANSTIKPELI
ncbi:hypothetical protein SynRS9909_01201 [Synechococcus sp. RS9909]|uniref:hypothetical protein n=1 Tax=Synechococcus sp. RS9909 TaxID=221352 RepID=UPI0018631322|nr:hypothetical protein [Synechococcus sp. RS9909]QNI79189.1 hypothetical protein SynRS9909_01201 [Synechococcus sp. RS9909]